MASIATDTILQKFERSPKLILYLEHAKALIAEERKKRKQFRDSINEDDKAEFINGDVIMHSPAQDRHTNAVQNLVFLISSYVRKRELGIVRSEKCMIALTRNDYEPDVVYLKKDKARQIEPDQHIYPAPDFIAEVLSRSTQRRDRGVKFEDYATHGVQEYWVVDPVMETLEQFVLRDGEYALLLKSNSDLVRCLAIKGFAIPIRAIFDSTENLKILQKLLA